MIFWSALLIVALIVIMLALWWQSRDLRRESHVRDFELPRGLFDRLRERRPELTFKECQLIAHALRQFFLAYLKSGRKYVSMPSQAVDDLWHEFILYTKSYDMFCRKAFGAFLHHTPAVALGSDRDGNAGLRRCFWYACKEENINPKRPTRLPLLFAIDAKLKIPNGFTYVADCSSIRRQSADAASARGSTGVYCGGDFSSSLFDGSTSGFGDSSTFGGGDSSGFFGFGGGDSGGFFGLGGGDSGGDSSGCGGGGCGGGD